MNPSELLKTMMDDGAWDGKHPVDIGDGFAVSPGEDGIAVFGEYFGGMVAVPWRVVRKLADCLHEYRSCANCAEMPDDGTCDKCGDSILTTKDAFVPNAHLTGPNGPRGSHD